LKKIKIDPSIILQ